MIGRISRRNSIIKWQGYRVSPSRLAESNFRYTQRSSQRLSAGDKQRAPCHRPCSLPSCWTSKGRRGRGLRHWGSLPLHGQVSILRPPDCTYSLNEYIAGNRTFATFAEDEEVRRFGHVQRLHAIAHGGRECGF